MYEQQKSTDITLLFITEKLIQFTNKDQIKTSHSFLTTDTKDPIKVGQPF